MIDFFFHSDDLVLVFKTRKLPFKISFFQKLCATPLKVFAHRLCSRPITHDTLISLPFGQIAATVK